MQAFDSQEPVQIGEGIESVNLYPGIQMIKDREMELTIEEVVVPLFSERFHRADSIRQRPGFFETDTWLRFELDNCSDQSGWLLEFAFPLTDAFQEGE